MEAFFCTVAESCMSNFFTIEKKKQLGGVLFLYFTI